MHKARQQPQATSPERRERRGPDPEPIPGPSRYSGAVGEHAGAEEGRAVYAGARCRCSHTGATLPREPPRKHFRGAKETLSVLPELTAFSPGPPPHPQPYCPWGRQLSRRQPRQKRTLLPIQRERVPPAKMPRREPAEPGQVPQSRRSRETTKPVFVYPCLPLVLSADVSVLNPVHSSATHSLQSKGVRDIATEVASQDLPLAGGMYNTFCQIDS
jgi:hypothetical protein